MHMTVTFPRPLRRWSFALASLALVAGPGVAPAAASGPVVLPLTGPPRAVPAAVDPGGPPLEDQILIRWRPGTTAADQAATARAYGLSSVPPGAGGLERANARLALTVAPGRSPAAVRRALAGDPRVLAVAANHRRELAADVTGEPFFDEQWGLRNTGQTIDGAGSITAVSGVDIDGSEAATIGLGSPAVVVAVIDNGVDFRNPDLAARAWTNPGEAGAKATNGIDDDHNGFVDDVHGWDFCDDDATVYDGPASGEYCHGTHVAGTIAASLDGIGAVGVAPSVKVMALKALDDDACGSDAQIIEAIDYAASFGIHLINASWGGIEPSIVLDQAIADSGALMIAAAGNSAVDMDVAGADRFYPAASNVPNV